MMKEKRKITLWLICLAFLFVQGTAFSASVPDPTAQMKPFLDKMISLIAAAAQGSQDEQETLCNRIIEEAQDHFDFQEMSKRVMGLHWRKLSDTEKRTFETHFTRLLQYAYLQQVGEYHGQTIEFVGQRIRNNRAEVQTVVLDKEEKIAVSYIMILKGDKWYAYDVVIEGISLVRNYMEQFKAVLRQDGFDALLTQIDEKVIAIEKERNNS